MAKDKTITEQELAAIETIYHMAELIKPRNQQEQDHLNLVHDFLVNDHDLESDADPMAPANVSHLLAEITDQLREINKAVGRLKEQETTSDLDFDIYLTNCPIEQDKDYQLSLARGVKIKQVLQYTEATPEMLRNKRVLIKRVLDRTGSCLQEAKTIARWQRIANMDVLVYFD